MFGLTVLKTTGFVAVLAIAAWSGAASASPITASSCIGTGYDLTTNVAGAADCAISSAAWENMNAVNPANMTVNRDGGFFGIDTWAIEGLLDDQGMLVGDAASAGKKNGSFDLTDYFAGMVGQVMLVFKSSSSDTTLVSYLFNLDGGATTLAGSWSTPFICPPFCTTPCSWTTQKAQHISVYSNVTPVAPVPLPAAGLLLMSGLGGLGLAKRRRRTV